jgi:hypothetical protein
MTKSTLERRTAFRWPYVLAAIAGPVGGGLIKIGNASTWAAVSVGLAPYVVAGALYALFMIAFIPAVLCYLFVGPDRQESIHRLIDTATDAIVCLLTLTHTRTRRQPVQLTQSAQPASRPGPPGIEG